MSKMGLSPPQYIEFSATFCFKSPLCPQLSPNRQVVVSLSTAGLSVPSAIPYRCHAETEDPVINQAVVCFSHSNGWPPCHPHTQNGHNWGIRIRQCLTNSALFHGLFWETAEAWLSFSYPWMYSLFSLWQRYACESRNDTRPCFSTLIFINKYTHFCILINSMLIWEKCSKLPLANSNTMGQYRAGAIGLLICHIHITFHTKVLFLMGLCMCVFV